MTIAPEKMPLHSSVSSHAGGAAAPGSATEKADFLLEAFVCGLHETSMQIGALTVLLGEYSRNGGERGLFAFRHVLTDDSKVMLLALGYASEIGLPVHLVEKLQRLYRDLSLAKSRLKPFVEFGAAHLRQRENASSLHQSWRHLADEASHSVRGLLDALGPRLNEVCQHDGRSVATFLKQVGAGDKAVVDDAGAPRLPMLKQRRRSPRLKVRQACTLILTTGVRDAELNDVSTNGLALASDATVVVGQPVIVGLADGRRLRATVKRVQGRSFGVILEKPLLPGDRLFSAAGTDKVS